MLKQIFVLVISLLAHLSYSQIPFTLPQNVVMATPPKATGQASGNVVKLNLLNNSKETIYFETAPIYIPSDGKYQAYIVPETYSIPLHPGRKTEIILKGYCLDLKRPAPPRNRNLPSIENWKYIENTINGSVNKYIVDPKYLTINRVISNLPQNLNVESKTALIPRERLEDGLHLILDAYHKLESSTRKAQNNQQLSTVFSYSPDKEKETLLQHSLWLYVAALTGNSYEYDYFEQKLIAEMENQLSQSFENMQNSLKNEIITGGQGLWSIFLSISEKSEIIKTISE